MKMNAQNCIPMIICNVRSNLCKRKYNIRAYMPSCKGGRWKNFEGRRVKKVKIYTKDVF